DVATDEGTSDLDGTEVTGFRNVNVTSNATINHFIIDGVDVASGLVAAGAAVSSTTVDGSAQAIIGDFTQIGTDTDALPGGGTVTPPRPYPFAPFPAGDPLGIAVGIAGVAGVAAGVTFTTITDEVTARIGDNAKIYASRTAGDITVHATGTVNADNLEID